MKMNHHRESEVIETQEPGRKANRSSTSKKGSSFQDDVGTRLQSSEGI